MNKTDCANRRIDVLAIGLFGLAVGALTVGLAQIGRIPEADKIGVLVVALVFGGLVQVLASITDIRYNEQLGGTALTMYGFFWVTVSTAKLLSEGTSFHFDDMLYIPIQLVYLVFSVVMIYLTAFRSATLSFLHVIITMTFLAMVFSRLGWISEVLPGAGHLAIGLLAFYHAIASLSFAFTGQALVPLGPPLLFTQPVGVAPPQLRHVVG